MPRRVMSYNEFLLFNHPEQLSQKQRNETRQIIANDIKHTKMMTTCLLISTITVIAVGIIMIILKKYGVIS